MGRRNLTPIQKIAITEKYRPVYVKMAEENKGGFKGNQYVSGSLPKSAMNQKINTRDELAKIAGIGHDTYNKGKKILDFEK